MSMTYSTRTGRNRSRKVKGWIKAGHVVAYWTALNPWTHKLEFGARVVR